MNKILGRLGLTLLTLTAATSCGKDSDPLDPLAAVDSVTSNLARQCGIDVDCKGGIVEGNASISGVGSVDAFFQSVIDYRSKADNVSSEIESQLAAIRGDFGLKAGASLSTELKAKVDASVEGKIKIQAEPARCAVDAHATLEAQARCDATIDPGKASVECKGECEVEASAEASCSAEADLECTFNAPSVMCEGQCKGSCDVDFKAAAACSGTCTGTCSGTCSAYSDEAATQCAGTCSGMCTGKCKTELAAEASCSGSCEGECTVTKPDGGCKGAVRAECKAKANAKVECKGRCVGEFEPPMAKAECEASAKAEARLNVECTPPRLVVDYKLKASATATAKAEFEAGIRNLKVRLPALLAAVERAKLVASAGADLADDAGNAVRGAVDTAVQGEGKTNLRAYFGLRCALGQLGAVDDAISDSSNRLNDALKAAGGVNVALGM